MRRGRRRMGEGPSGIAGEVRSWGEEMCCHGGQLSHGNSWKWAEFYRNCLAKYRFVSLLWRIKCLDILIKDQ